MVCRQCHGIETLFNSRRARGELAAYRRNGPRKMTRLLIDAIKAEGVEGRSVLDIGGGIGAIHHELLKAGAGSAVAVEASTAFTQAAEHESQRQGHADRASYRHGDFVELAGEIEPADIVTLDRVICCYPDLEALVGLSSQRATRLYALIYPVDSLPLRFLSRLFNFGLWLCRNPFRFFVHPTAAIDALLQSAGFHRRSHHKGVIWQAAVYRRRPAETGVQSPMPVATDTTNHENG